MPEFEMNLVTRIYLAAARPGPLLEIPENV